MERETLLLQRHCDLQVTHRLSRKWLLEETVSLFLFPVVLVIIVQDVNDGFAYSKFIAAVIMRVIIISLKLKYY